MEKRMSLPVTGEGLVADAGSSAGARFSSSLADEDSSLLATVSLFPEATRPLLWTILLNARYSARAFA